MNEKKLKSKWKSIISFNLLILLDLSISKTLSHTMSINFEISSLKFNEVCEHIPFAKMYTYVQQKINFVNIWKRCVSTYSLLTSPTEKYVIKSTLTDERVTTKRLNDSIKTSTYTTLGLWHKNAPDIEMIKLTPPKPGSVCQQKLLH